MRSGEIEERKEAYTEAWDLAWKHFDLHAKQRIEMFKSYITLMTIAYGAFGLAAQTKMFVFGFVFCLLSVGLSVIFFLFDLRIRQLIKIAERYLLHEEGRLAAQISNRDIMLFRKSNLISHIAQRRGVRLSYSELFRITYGFNIIIALVIFMAFIIYSST